MDNFETKLGLAKRAFRSYQELYAKQLELMYNEAVADESVNESTRYKIFAEFFSFFLAHDSLPVICDIYYECAGKTGFENIRKIIRDCSFFPLVDKITKIQPINVQLEGDASFNTIMKHMGLMVDLFAVDIKKRPEAYLTLVNEVWNDDQVVDRRDHILNYFGSLLLGYKQKLESFLHTVEKQSSVTAYRSQLKSRALNVKKKPSGDPIRLILTSIFQRDDLDTILNKLVEQRNERQTTEQNNPRIPIGTQFQYNGQDVITIPYDHYQQLINDTDQALEEILNVTLSDNEPTP